jgi:predicted dehydrogenase
MVRFGIAGFGLHAVKRLMPGFAWSKNCRVAALSRRNITEAKQSAAEYGIPLAFDSVADLCQSPEVDAVLVTTPNSAHLTDVLDAVDAGKPVLCEKPLGMNSDECRQMVKAARHKGVLFGVAHVFRFNESVRGLREWIAEGRIGRPVFARSEFSFFADASHPRKWLFDASIAGAGPILDIGVHCVDTLRYILNDEVVRVSASAVSDEHSGDVESAALINLEFSRGTMGMVPVSYRAEYRTPIELIGSSGVLRADDALNVERPIELQLLRDGAVAERKSVSNELVYAAQVDAFADAVEGKAPFLIPGEEGWRNQEILDAALRSVKSGKVEAAARVVI